MKWVVAILCCARLAQADGWQDKVAHAERVRHLEDVVWAITATCEGGDDVVQRQCRHLRDTRLAALATATLVVDGDAEAFEVGKWSPAKRSVTVRLAACIRCGGLDVDGKQVYVVGSAAQQRLEGDKLHANPLYDTARPFPTGVAADKWTRSVHGARVELLVKLPAKPRWQLGTRPGVAFEVLAYRVYSPCTGEIVVASDPSEPLTADPKTCSKDPVEAPEEVDDLNAEVAHAALRSVDDAAQVCFTKLGLSGKAMLVISIAADGSIAKYDQTGDFKGTPTGDCIDRSLVKVHFPRSKGPTRIKYPIVLGRP
jgi:hypothetical protein